MGTRIGLVLGAGAFAGRAFHAGVLCALASAFDWDPRTADVIVGTSIGSHVGAGLRAGLSAPDIAAFQTSDEVSEEGRALMRRFGAAPTFTVPAARSFVRRPHAPSRALVRAAVRHPWRSVGAVATSFLPEGPLDSERYAVPFRRFFADEWPDDPLWICAARKLDGRRVVFGRRDAPPADVASAIAASCAIPGIFRSVVIGGEAYVDGGVYSPTNLDLVGGLGLDLAIVVSPMSMARSVRRAPDLPLRQLFRWRLAGEANRVRATGTSVVAFQPSASDIAVMGLNALSSDADRWARVVEIVREETLERLEEPAFAGRLAALGRPRRAGPSRRSA